MLSAAGVCWFSLVLLILFLPEKFAGQAGVACCALMPARLRPYPVLSSPLAGPAVHKVLDFGQDLGPPSLFLHDLFVALGFTSLRLGSSCSWYMPFPGSEILPACIFSLVYFCPAQ